MKTHGYLSVALLFAACAPIFTQEETLELNEDSIVAGFVEAQENSQAESSEYQLDEDSIEIVDEEDEDGEDSSEILADVDDQEGQEVASPEVEATEQVVSNEEQLDEVCLESSDASDAEASDENAEQDENVFTENDATLFAIFLKDLQSEEAAISERIRNVIAKHSIVQKYAKLNPESKINIEIPLGVDALIESVEQVEA